MNVSDLQKVADDVSALNAMQAQLAKQVTQVRDHLMKTGQDFASQSSEKVQWLRSSKYAPVLMSGAVSDGSYTFSAHGGLFVFSSQVDGWGSWSTFEVTPADAANFTAFLEKQYQGRKN